WRLWPADGRGDPLAFPDALSLSVDAAGRILTTTPDAVQLWSADGALLATRDGPVLRAELSRDGKWIVSYHDDGKRLWKGDLTAPVVLPGARGRLGGQTFSADSRWIAYVVDQGISFRPTDDSGPATLLRAHIKNPAAQISLSPDASLLVVASGWGDVTLYRTHGTADPTTLVRTDAFHDAMGWFSRDGTRVFTFTSADARIFPARDPPGIRSFRPGARAEASVVSADARFVFTISSDIVLRIWPVAGGEPVRLP